MKPRVAIVLLTLALCLIGGDPTWSAPKPAIISPSWELTIHTEPLRCIKVKVPGKQHPVRLGTKSSTLLDEVRATEGEIASFYYTEKESTKINPNTQRPYTNRYLESVTPGAVAGAGGGSGGSERMT